MLHNIAAIANKFKQTSNNKFTDEQIETAINWWCDNIKAENIDRESFRGQLTKAIDTKLKKKGHDPVKVIEDGLNTYVEASDPINVNGNTLSIRVTDVPHPASISIYELVKDNQTRQFENESYLPEPESGEGHLMTITNTGWITIGQIFTPSYLQKLYHSDDRIDLFPYKEITDISWSEETYNKRSVGKQGPLEIEKFPDPALVRKLEPVGKNHAINQTLAKTDLSPTEPQQLKGYYQAPFTHTEIREKDDDYHIIDYGPYHIAKVTSEFWFGCLEEDHAKPGDTILYYPGSKEFKPAVEILKSNEKMEWLVEAPENTVAPGNKQSRKNQGIAPHNK